LAQIAFSRRALEDFERVFTFYAKDDPQLAAAQVAAIRQAIAVLSEHPFIGRVTKYELRELVISRGKTGFLALYRFSPSVNTVRVLRIRHQRELGYPQV
jgi:plasmid stabilization system protein ParE